MADRIQTLRELNRTILARQMLLSRDSGAATEAVSRLVGLQAQSAVAPFVGLWTRVEGLSREEVARLIEDKTILKATMMRGTLHLLTAADYLEFRSTLQPVFDAALAGILKGRADGLDVL
ncbi:MAG TPA: crosslink repair DNA glycosylase YcaQ family protein, partial [Actinomycetota bacterium]|nr:crosslink repair DNA glycosylase YcaQ family protein [Actinomycetota bacterium]